MLFCFVLFWGGVGGRVFSPVFKKIQSFFALITLFPHFAFTWADLRHKKVFSKHEIFYEIPRTLSNTSEVNRAGHLVALQIICMSIFKGDPTGFGVMFEENGQVKDTDDVLRTPV